MNDFNVVGLPDNAVKESRERIKSALRNCGIEFPYGQGVTINLAPADVKKEGSAFDLPMALGLAGCMGQFFGKPINKMMFLGELSLDGSIRPVRGALSAALAARESGLIALAVPEANAREAAVVDGIKIYAVKTLPQTVDLVNAPESFSPIQVDAQLLLSEAADIWCRPPRSSRPAIRQARSRSRLRRWPQHSLHRPSRGRKNHARQAHSHYPSAHVTRRSHRNHAHSFRRGHARRFPRPRRHAPLSLPASHYQRCWPHRRRRNSAPGRSLPRPQRRPLPR